MKNETFTLRISQNERLALAELARRMNRSQSDTIRFLIAGFLRELNQVEKVPLTNKYTDAPI